MCVSGVSLREEVGSKSRATKATKELLDVIDEAIHWLCGERKPQSQQADEWRATCTVYDLAFEGKSEVFEELLSAPSPRDGGPPAWRGISW